MFHHNFPELMLTSIYNDTKQRNQDMKEWQGKKTEKQKGRYRTNKNIFFLKRRHKKRNNVIKHKNSNTQRETVIQKQKRYYKKARQC